MIMKDVRPPFLVTEQEMIFVGQPYVGSMILTNTPSKGIYRRVQWIDSRQMTFPEAKSLASGLSLLGDQVMFDCFDQVTVCCPGWAVVATDRRVL